jgi:hypothetical protein
LPDSRQADALLSLAGEGAVEDKKSPVEKGAHNCKWAEPTLFEPAPDWLEAEAKPWTCHRDAVPKHLETTEICDECPRWEQRDQAGEVKPKA